MNAAILVVRELSMRRRGAMLCGLGVAIAAGGLVAGEAVLRAHDIKEEAALLAKGSQTRLAADKFANAYKTITGAMGFTYRIIASRQDEADFFSAGYCRKTMAQNGPVSNALRAVGGAAAVVPVLRQKVWWPEQRRYVLVCGVGLTPKPFVRGSPGLPSPSHENAAVAGFQIGSDLGLQGNDALFIRGVEVTVDSLAPQRGTADDITLWMPLATVQKLLALPNRISELWVWADASANPDEFAANLTKAAMPAVVVEMKPQETVRRQSLAASEIAAAVAVAREREAARSASLRRRAMAHSAAAAGCAAALAWTAALSFANVFFRRRELGILRALGIGTRAVAAMCACRFALVGTAGAIAGCAAGTVVAAAAHCVPTLGWAAAIVAAAGALSAMAGLIPALWAAGRDPATVLARQ